MNQSVDNISVILIEDQPIAQEAIKNLLVKQKRIQWLGEADDGIPGITLIEHNQPTVAIVDYYLKSLGELELIEKIRTASSDTIIVSLTQVEDPFLILQMIEAGSHAILTKSHSHSLINDIYTLVDKRKTLLQEDLGHQVVHAALERQLIFELNCNEMHYFLKTGQGIGHEKIANELAIKPVSVKKLLARTKKKLKVKTKADLIALYQRFFPGGYRKYLRN